MRAQAKDHDSLGKCWCSFRVDVETAWGKDRDDFRERVGCLGRNVFP